ncbi:MAG: hypothetical protein WKF84_30280 [Pyrinomonadaceae bacterium]
MLLAMRPIEKLTFEAIISRLHRQFEDVERQEQAASYNYPLSDVLMSGFAMLFFQDPSLLAFQERMLKKHQRCNLETMFGVAAVPKESQMRERLDDVPSEGVRELMPALFEQVRRTGWLREWLMELSDGGTAGAYYVMAVDGSDYFSSERINCEKCLVRADRAGDLHYRHTVVAATLVKSGKRLILPLDAEECGPQDGSEKQDCELNAGKRLVRRVRGEHPHLRLIVTGDDLYSHVPFVQACEQARLHYVLVAKPDSHQELFEWVEDLEKLGASESVAWHVGPACARKFYQARIVREVPLRADGAVSVTFVEVWERDQEGNELYHNSFVTDLEVTTKNVSEIISIGRAKWKIENEQFNIQKNHGYHLTHNFGHGQQNLSSVFYYLNLVAYLVHIILERGDTRFQKARATVSSRARFWDELRTLMRRLLWESWAQMMEFVGNEELASSP